MSSAQIMPRRSFRRHLSSCAFPEIRSSGLGCFAHQLQLGGQGDGMQVVSLDNGPPRALPQSEVRLWIREGIHNGFSDLLGVEEFHQQSVLPVTQNLLDGRSSGANYETTGRHCFKHGPGEDEGVGKVQVYTGHLQHREEGRIRNPAQEVHAAQIERVAEFPQHLLAVGLSVRKPHPIAHLVASNDDHLSFGTPREDGRKAVHQHLEPSVGFQISRNVSENLIPGGELSIAIAESEAGRRSGLYNPRIDSLVDNTQHRVVSLRVERLLPARGAMTQVGRLEAQKIADVPGTETWSGIDLLGDSGFKFYISSFRAIEEFEVADEWNLWVDILQVPDFTPTVVTEHNVGHKTRLLKRHGCSRYLLAIQHPRLCLPKIVVRMPRRPTFWRVDHLFYATDSTFLSLREKHNFVAGLRGKVTNEMKVLPREILMHKHNLHNTVITNCKETMDFRMSSPDCRDPRETGFSTLPDRESEPDSPLPVALELPDEAELVMREAGVKVVGTIENLGRWRAVRLLTICVLVCGITVQGRATAGILGFGVANGRLAKLEFQLKEGYQLTSVAWSPDGRYIATGSTMDRRIDIWDISQRKVVKVLVQRYPSASFHEITWSPNGQYLAFCDSPGALRIFRASDWTQAHVLSPAGNAGCSHSAFSSDSSQVALLGTDFLGIYSVGDWRTLSSLNLDIGWGRGDFFNAIAYLPNSHIVLVGGGQHVTVEFNGIAMSSWDGRVWFFDDVHPAPIRMIQAYRPAGDHGGGGQIRSLTTSPDGRYIATGVNTGAGGAASGGIARQSVHILAVSDGRLDGAPLDGLQPGKFGEGVAIAYTHDGRYIIVPHEVRDGWVHVIDGQTARVIDLVKVNSFAFDVSVNHVNDEFAVAAGNAVTVWSMPDR